MRQGRNEIAPLVKKGERGLRTAKKLLKDGDSDFCASRAYYAMLHVTEALLLTKNIASSKHSGVLMLLYEHFVKPGLLEKTFHQDLHEAFELRQQGDYWSDSGITVDMAEEILQKAEKYISVLKGLL